MRIEKANQAIAKGWYTGPWDSDLDISLGFANEGVDEPHYHQQQIIENKSSINLYINKQYEDNSPRKR